MPPLECRYIEEDVRVEVGGVPVIAHVRANWGAAEVTIEGRTAVRDRRGSAFAMLAFNTPSGVTPSRAG
jgi:hypothetical protein